MPDTRADAAAIFHICTRIAFTAARAAGKAARHDGSRFAWISDSELQTALEVELDMDIHRLVVERLSMGERIDYIICDEAQFYQPIQIDQLAKIVDGLGIDVYAFGILADFRTKLFPGSARLVELADRVNTLQVEALCWCGSRATHNARTVNGVMVTEGEQVVVGDVGKSDEIAYEVLCRRHHMRQVTARASRAGHISSDPLPFIEPTSK